MTIDALRQPRSAAAVAFVLLLAALLLSACGGSSSESSNGSASGGTSASKSTGDSGASSGGSATTHSPNASGAPLPRNQVQARVVQLRKCMSKHGVTLPARPSGRGAISSERLPQGVTREQFRAALEACGGANFARARGRARLATRAQRLTEYAACMRKHGIHLPPPNTSGKRPPFNTSGVNTHSATYKTAVQACVNELIPLSQSDHNAGAPGVVVPPSTGG